MKNVLREFQKFFWEFKILAGEKQKQQNIKIFNKLTHFHKFFIQNGIRDFLKYFGNLRYLLGKLKNKKKIMLNYNKFYFLHFYL